MGLESLKSIASKHGADFRIGEPMARHTSLGIGGGAEFFLRPAGWDSAPVLLAALWDCEVPFRVIAGGTKLLVEDGSLGFGVLCLGRCGGSARWSGTGVEADADLPLPVLCAQATRNGLSGLEGMEGIPGTVGGALIMNAGAWGCEMGALVREVSLIEREMGRRSHPASEFQFEYRRSTVRGRGVVAGCRLELSPSEAAEIQRRTEECRVLRRATQPWKEATAGSVFKNPPGMAAGRILEELGFKGKRKGGAGFSALHANFLVNYGGATFKEAFSLCEEAREVAAGAGIPLEYEVEIWKRSQGFRVGSLAVEA